MRKNTLERKYFNRNKIVNRYQYNLLRNQLNCKGIKMLKKNLVSVSCCEQMENIEHLTFEYPETKTMLKRASGKLKFI